MFNYKDDITIYRFSGLNDFGKTKDPTQDTIKGEVQSSVRTVTNDNMEFVSTANVLSTKSKLHKKDEIEKDGDRYSILKIDEIKKPFSKIVDHYEIYF